ncbi:MAG: sigma-54 dependent transcriptional regulator, partial [Verrucomicrobiae bacterium]|nr:sigma-54 dependent transcriptional regulator [Verrucomicrobiae bacterium]
MDKPRILIVDDEEGARESLRMVLKTRYDVCMAADGTSALGLLQSGPAVSLVLLDMRLPDINGLDLLGKVQRLSPGTPVVMVTAVNETKPAVEAMKMGAVDYLTKPFDANEILRVVERELGQSAAPEFENIVGNGPAMRKVYALMRQLLPTDSTVLITGETGTGKELVARALHNYGPRKTGPFVPVHCATVPSELLESELFGHERGSFTGATQRRIGVFESANGGTLFLDEIGDIPLPLQAKLLRVLQERVYEPLGGIRSETADVRVIAATNKNLAERVQQNMFREDLYYRINVVRVDLPPLRRRK